MPKPPPLPLLAYRFVGWRLGPDHRDWVHDDITSRGWLIRQGAPALSGVLLVGAAITGMVGGDGSRVWAAVLVLTVAGLFLRRSLRQRSLQQQGIDEQGNPLPTAGWYDDDQRRIRRNLASAVGTVVLTVGGLLILALRS